MAEEVGQYLVNIKLYVIKTNKKKVQLLFMSLG